MYDVLQTKHTISAYLIVGIRGAVEGAPGDSAPL